MRRLWVRMLFVVILAVAAVQIVFAPVRIVRRTPEYQGFKVRVNLGLDLQGGSYLVLEAQDTQTLRATPETVDAAMRVIENRIDQLGVVEPTVQRQGSRRIIVELPGIQDPERAIELIGKTALLEFVDTQLTQLPQGARWSADGKTVQLPPPAQPLTLEKKVILTGADLADAQASFDQTTGEPIVNFQLKGKGAKVFEEFTAANIGKYLTIVLDDEVISSPVIRDRIGGGNGQISGGFRDIAEARDLAVLLRGGALPVPVEVIERRSVGPTLGRDSLDRTLRAGGVALVMVLLFMILLYGVGGLLADAALVLYGIFLLAGLTALGATLTLPGIAAFILSVGMAIDANILIFERIKEELRAGKTLRAAIGGGWTRAWSAILDSNVTTLLAALVLFVLGTGPIKGFAVTLALGVVISMFTAIVVTRILVDSTSAALRPSWLRFGAER
ncbi:MAG: protein translocase subunit SecD [Armatimonadota bacterium]|nr:protein translocase subunit SecD [Armatimonadota bacterium]MDR7451921.1 protein translocase subunit SecD [Armatimonadota bacterium]MDR7466603.1 protein translocase subunit SecD [Armatimonadota bacterium]MDR7492923.1 protein translocase subunit SecD [Armatimonadota bacterium]MDR7500320.1 protein translocase subunit SecD [Armatimonadota bacterium]